jgi:hypothetical protein
MNSSLPIQWPQVDFDGNEIALERDETKNREGGQFRSSMATCGISFLPPRRNAMNHGRIRPGYSTVGVSRSRTSGVAGRTPVRKLESLI